MNPLFSVPDSPPTFVTTTFTVPLACAGVTAVIEVLPTTLTELAGVPPNETLAPAPKPVPEIVTAVPPAAGPDDGETPPTAGAVFIAPEKNSDMFAAVDAAPG